MAYQPLPPDGQATMANSVPVVVASDQSAIPVTLASTTITGTVDTELSAAAALTDNFANPTAGGVGAFNMLWDGATWDRAPGTSALGLLTNIGTIAGTAPTTAGKLDVKGADGDVFVRQATAASFNATVVGTGTFAVQADTELPAAAALADDTANPTAPAVGAHLLGWDTATWDRLHSRGTASDNLGTIAAGVLATVACGFMFDGSGWDRVRGDSTDGLLVNLGSNNDVTVTSGSISATQGTSPWVVSGTVATTNADLTTLASAVHLEDDVATSGHAGIGALVQQRATPTDTAGNTDYSFLQMSAGRLWTSATIDAALPAGTNAIGKLAANDGVDIGDVTINNAAGAAAVNIQDGGNIITVDGTVATTNADLTTLASAVHLEDDVAASGHAGIGALVQQRATPTDTAGNTDYSLLQMSAGRLWVDPSGVTLTVASHAVTNAGTFVVQIDGAALTALQLIDDTITTLGTDTYTEASTKGSLIAAVRRDADTTLVDTTNEITPLQVDARGALKVEVFSGETLPVSLASTTVTGTVAVTQSTTPWVTSGAKNMGTGGSTYSSLDIGVAAVGVRRTDGSALSATANNYIPLLLDTDGHLWVAGSRVDDVAFTAATSRVMVAGGFFNNSSPDSVDEGDAGALRMSANRNLFVTLRDAAGNERGLNIDANGELSIGAIRTSITPGTAAANLGKAEDSVHTTGDVGVFALAVANEANTARAADGDYIAFATDTEGNIRVVGNRDHDAVDAGEPVKIGMRALAHGTNPTAVAAADRTDWIANRAGVPWVIGGHPAVVTLRANYTGAQTDAAIVTVAGGLKIVVTRLSVLADNANSVDVQARIGFAAATTPTTTGVLLSHPGIAAGSGVIEGNGSGMLGVGADGEDLRITSEVPTGGSIDVVVTYYTIES